MAQMQEDATAVSVLEILKELKIECSRRNKTPRSISLNRPAAGLL
jgi:hypothetical protein